MPQAGDGVRGCFEVLADPYLFDLEHRLASLQRRKVELQLVGPPPFLVAWPGGVAGSELVRALHKMLGDVAAESGGLMEAIGVLALAEPDKVVDELRRAVDEHGIRALIKPTAAGARTLDDPVFDPVFEPLFALIERLGLATA